MKQAQQPHQKIGDRRQEQSCSHETAYIAVVCDESVEKLAHGINEKQCGADKTKLSGSQHPLIYKRLLNDTEAHTAYIIKAISHCNAPKRPVPQGLVSPIHPILRHLCLRRLAYPVK